MRFRRYFRPKYVSRPPYRLRYRRIGGGRKLLDYIYRSSEKWVKKPSDQPEYWQD